MFSTRLSSSCYVVVKLFFRRLILIYVHTSFPWACLCFSKKNTGRISSLKFFSVLEKQKRAPLCFFFFLISFPLYYDWSWAIFICSLFFCSSYTLKSLYHCWPLKKKKTLVFLKFFNVCILEKYFLSLLFII